MTENKITKTEAAAFLRAQDEYLILTHRSPDADTIGSAAALVRILRALGKTAAAYCPDPIPRRLEFLTAGAVFAPALPDTAGKTLVSVDVASGAMTGLGEETVFALSIDHHKVNTVRCERLCIEPDYVATGEIILELADELEVPLTQETALPLYAAISSDSGGFRYAATRPETHLFAARLLETGIDFAEINRRLFETKTPAQLSIERLAYSRIELYCGGRFALLAVDQEDLERTGAGESDIDGLNQLPRQIEGVRVSAVIRPKPGCVKVSLRSNDETDVAQLAERFGGGGHFHAAGFSLEGKSVPDAKRLVLDVMEELFA